MNGSGERFLIVKTSSMGDVVHALPLASDLARRYPDSAVDWLVEESFAAIPRMHVKVDRVVAVAVRRWRRAPLSSATWREVRAAKEQLRARPYRAILDCQGLLKSAWMARWARGPRWGFDRASEQGRECESRHQTPNCKSRSTGPKNRARGGVSRRRCRRTR